MNKWGVFWVALFCMNFTNAQMYKSWFVNTDECINKNIIVGFANKSIISDTSFIQASFINACENYAYYKSSFFSGYRLNRGTDIGTYAIEDIITETFDSSIFIYALENFKILDTLIVNNLVSTLVGTDEIIPDYTEKVNFKTTIPGWVLKIPEENNSIYAMGVSPAYYYEASSWLTAEKTGRKYLAGAYYSKIESLLKTAHSKGDNIIKEEIYSRLHSIKVISRYYGNESKIFYALMKMTL